MTSHLVNTQLNIQNYKILQLIYDVLHSDLRMNK